MLTLSSFLEEKAHLVEGFEGESRRERSRIVSLTVKLYRRTYHVAICTVQSFQVYSVLQHVEEPKKCITILS